jgi:hypothetical protein
MQSAFITASKARRRDLTRGLLALLALGLLNSGCVCVLRCGSPATEVKLRLDTLQTQDWSVRIATEPPSTHSVAPTGCVEFTVRAMRGSCDYYLFGCLKTRDGSAEAVPVVEVVRDGRVLRKLSLDDIAKLPRDAAGFSVMKIAH